MRQCSGCDWNKGLEDSDGDMVYFCMNTNSGAYLEQVGDCGNCGLEEDEE